MTRTQFLCVTLLISISLFLDCTSNPSSEQEKDSNNDRVENDQDPSKPISNGALDLNASWHFLYDFEDKTILDLFDQVPTFKALVKDRLGEKYELITDLEAKAAYLTRTSTYMLISGTIRHGFPDDETMYFYSSDLIIDVPHQRIFALNYQSDSDQFDYYFDDPVELPVPVVKELEGFYLRPSQKAVKDWNILDYYQLLSFQLLHPIKKIQQEYKIGDHYGSNVEQKKAVIDLQNGFIEFDYQDQYKEFTKNVKVALFRKSDGNAVIGVSSFNSHPAWVSYNDQAFSTLKFYGLTKDKRLEEVTHKVLSTQKLLTNLLPVTISPDYEGQGEFGLYHLKGAMPRHGADFNVTFNFNNLIGLCDGEAPDWLDEHYEDAIINDEINWTCPPELATWNNKEIKIHWNPEGGYFLLGSGPFPVALSGLVKHRYDDIHLMDFNKLNTQTISEDPPVLLAEDPNRNIYRLAVKRDSSWLSWVFDPKFRIEKDSKVDSLKWMEFDGNGDQELIIHFSKKEAGRISEADQLSHYLHIWKLDTLRPYFRGLIACEEQTNYANNFGIPFQTSASIEIDMKEKYFMASNIKSNIKGEKNATGEYLMIDEMSNDTVILGDACGMDQFEVIEGLYYFSNGKLVLSNTN